MIKKLTPASICAQKKWAGFPQKLKKELGRTLPDKDKDCVPNGFDCKPKNRKRQESFLSSDAAFLNTNPSITADELLGRGTCGDVYSVKEHKNLTVKVPKNYIHARDNADDTLAMRRHIVHDRQKNLEDEYKFCEVNNLDQEPLFTPTRRVIMKPNGLGMDNVIGLVRPKVTPIEMGKGNITDSQLAVLKAKIIEVSNKGYVLDDGVQVGVDSVGRLLLFDVGYAKKSSVKSAFERNNEMWIKFLRDVSDIRTGSRISSSEAVRRYGTL